MKYSLLISALLGFALAPNASSAVIYTYDFPGSDGSGLAVDQTNPQPSGAVFSDFTRNGGLSDTGRANEFESKDWAESATLDPNIWAGFTITADPGMVLTLTSLTFDSMKNGAGLSNAQVSLFINGSSSAYATYGWTPASAPIQSYTFDFADIPAATEATTVTFKFYGWNAGGPSNAMRFDNVATHGAVVVPEPGTWAAGLFVLLVAALKLRKRRSAGLLRLS